MRLALKFVLAFTVVNIALAAIYGYLAMRRESLLFEESATEEANTLGHALEDMLTQVWQSSGQRGVMQFVERANEGQTHNVRIRWVWFDAARGDPDAPWAPREQLTAVLLERHGAIEGVAPEGTPYLNIYWPMAVATPRRGGLEFSRPLTELDEKKRDVLRRTGLLVAGMASLSGLLAFALGIPLVGRPLRQLIEKTRRIASGDLTGPVKVRAGDELAELADSLNLMCEQLAASQIKIREEAAARIAALEQLRHADRLKTVGRLAAGIAHELGTPLNVVSGRAGLIVSGKLTDTEIAQSAIAIKSETDKMTGIIRQLLDFARASVPNKSPVDLSTVASQTLEMLRPLAEKRQVQVCLAAVQDPSVAKVDAAQIQQVLTNLIVNAVQVSPAGGKVDVAIRCQLARAPESVDGREFTYLAIDVRDQGTGIAEEHLPHLFEPFFTTKGIGEGTGLGLSIAYGIVQEHGGWIDVSSRPNEGSCFTVFLPEGVKT